MSELTGNRFKPASVLADLAGRDVAELYRLMRLPDAPKPDHVIATVPHWDVATVLRWLKLQ